ncbi:MAG: hybrid sensor histidine kinase/response regulator [Alkalinema sp. RU_4_3]|nr:hybrid sensor histidine kinase/response regulator [Alkalinema sp. RU_4_3]
MKKPVVICVDDEPTVLDSLKVELRRGLSGQCLIEIAESGEETLELLEELLQDDYEVALVIADYIMPGLKGDELLHQIHDRSPRTINIMLSGQADLDAVGRSIKYANLYRFISKPWHSADLGLTVSEALQSYHQGQQLESQNAKLKKLYQEVQVLNENLEQQVEERTQQLQVSLREIKELSQMKEDLLHAVSHDLRTPVTGMLMVLKRLQGQTEDTVSFDRSILNRMVSSSERQLQLLDMLLETHLGDMRGLKLNLGHHGLQGLVAELVQDLEPILQSNQATLINLVPADLPSLMIDRLQISRIYENLITNALKHNSPGICITLRTVLEPPFVRCLVQDDGNGMDQAQCDHLFERYSQGPNRIRRSVGIGLGLYLCRQIVQGHGGAIRATSAPGQGLKVCFSLPIAP